MEARVAVLEQIAKDTKEAISGMRGDIARLISDVSEIKGGLAKLPSTWVMLVALVGGQITLAGLLFAALRLGAGH